MTKDDIIRMARDSDSGFDGGADADGTMTDSLVGIAAIIRFAELVAEAERKACTKICTDRYEKYMEPEVFEIAEAIMSRFPTLSELLESKHS